MMDDSPSDEETEQQRDSQFMGAASIISTEGEGGSLHFQCSPRWGRGGGGGKEWGAH